MKKYIAVVFIFMLAFPAFSDESSTPELNIEFIRTLDDDTGTKHWGYYIGARSTGPIFLDSGRVAYIGRNEDRSEVLKVFDVNDGEFVISYPFLKNEYPRIIRIFDSIFTRSEKINRQFPRIKLLGLEQWFGEHLLYRYEEKKLYLSKSGQLEELIVIPTRRKASIDPPVVAPDGASVFFLAYEGEHFLLFGTLYRLSLDDYSIEKILHYVGDFAFFGEDKIVAYQLSKGEHTLIKRMTHPGDFIVIDIGSGSVISLDEYDYLNNREFVINKFDIRGEWLAAFGAYQEFDEGVKIVDKRNVLLCRIME